MLSAEDVARSLETAIEPLPQEFYASYEYTRTGWTYAHPVTVGLLAKILWQDPSVAHVGVDFKLNLGGERFEPDLLALDCSLQPLLIVDYESPNSSDARIPAKHVANYILWSRSVGEHTNYYIVTTLPAARSSTWKLMYTSAGRTNAEFGGRRRSEYLRKVRENPFRFWYSYYSTQLEGLELAGIRFINVDRKSVRPVTLPVRDTIPLP